MSKKDRGHGNPNRQLHLGAELRDLAAAGSNIIRADSETLLAIGAAIGLEPDELAAKVAEAAAITIP